MAVYDLVCVGCGPAGETAAVTAAQQGFRVLVVEAAGRPGGAMVNTGTIASKVLRETALTCSAFRRRPVPGIDATPDTRLSLSAFMARTTLVQLEEHDRIETELDRAGVEVTHGRAMMAGPNQIDIHRADGGVETVTTRFTLIATGSRPARPAWVDFDHPCIVDADGLLELPKMPRSIVIIGGGVIGSEYACIFAELGIPTTLVEPRNGLMRFLDAEIRGRLEAEMAETGVDLQLGRKPTRVTGSDQTGIVELDDGTRLESEIVLWSLGRQGNAESLGLENAGITANDRGLITVDHEYRTTCPTVFAAGDVIGFPALASTGIEQGRVAACRMFDFDDDRALADTVPMGIYTIPAVGHVGLNLEEAGKKGHDAVVGRAEYRRNARGRMLGDARGLLKLVVDRETERLLGCSVVGEDATELVHLAQFAISTGQRIGWFEQACFNYPSLNGLFREAADDARLAIIQASGRAAA
ncbi:MAG: Si-specific NAD(P)(+) transhydrogenase [Phycisphaera sp. TMED9]|nr:MAG: Si-specific NAD(P)(+) transhydrogenase [Phycisphaera sp. TMED9]